jgi:hypothetical protein
VRGYCLSKGTNIYSKALWPPKKHGHWRLGSAQLTNVHQFQNTPSSSTLQWFFKLSNSKTLFGLWGLKRHVGGTWYLYYTHIPFMSPYILSHPLSCHQTLGNGYTQLKITYILSLSPLFISPQCNAKVTIEGSSNMQKFLSFVTHFANFLYINDSTLLLLMTTHLKPEVWQLFEIHFLSL